MTTAKITLSEERLIKLCRDAFCDGYYSADGHRTPPWDTSEALSDVKRLIDEAKMDEQTRADYREAGLKPPPL